MEPGGPGCDLGVLLRGCRDGAGRPADCGGRPGPWSEPGHCPGHVEKHVRLGHPAVSYSRGGSPAARRAPRSAGGPGRDRWLCRFLGDPRPLTDDRDAASEYLDQLERDPVGGRGSDLDSGCVAPPTPSERRAASVSFFWSATGRVPARSSRQRSSESRAKASGSGRSASERSRALPYPFGPGRPSFNAIPSIHRSRREQSSPRRRWPTSRRQTGGTYQRLHVDSDLSSAIAPAWSLPADDPVGGTVRASVSRVLLLIALLVLGADTALGVARDRSSRFT